MLGMTKTYASGPIIRGFHGMRDFNVPFAFKVFIKFIYEQRTFGKTKTCALGPSDHGFHGMLYSNVSFLSKFELSVLERKKE